MIFIIMIIWNAYDLGLLRAFQTIHLMFITKRLPRKRWRKSNNQKTAMQQTRYTTFITFVTVCTNTTSGATLVSNSIFAASAAIATSIWHKKKHKEPTTIDMYWLRRHISHCRNYWNRPNKIDFKMNTSESYICTYYSKLCQ